MSQFDKNDENRERAIARLLHSGAWLASAIIGLGLIVGFLQPMAKTVHTGQIGFALEKVGVALFILLPVSRVALMLALFVRERDFTYAAISALVLAIIAAGFLAGL